MESVRNEIKQLIIETLNLEEMTPSDIDSEAPLFGDGLGLDSIDALELGLAIKNKFEVVLSSENEETKKHFYSVATLANFVTTR
ncbi:phosphopantetheine-binding protein [Orbaceae bacterium ESL0721]|nr:phosphopantetheine-binding protein [Orbaceae bacterium ESL0721]